MAIRVVELVLDAKGFKKYHTFSALPLTTDFGGTSVVFAPSYLQKLTYMNTIYKGETGNLSNTDMT